MRCVVVYIKSAYSASETEGPIKSLKIILKVFSTKKLPRIRPLDSQSLKKAANSDL